MSVGNTRTKIGSFRGRELLASAAIPNTDVAAIAEAVIAAARDRVGPAVVLASVNPTISERLLPLVRTGVSDVQGELYQLGVDLPVPIERALDDDSTVGQDRLLNALAAFVRAGQACIVVDCGTAMTCDFVDGTGVFQGGAIAPGLGMMLDAMHQRTAKLPAVSFEQVPASRPFGKSTGEAMRLGAQAAAQGMVRVLAERYAESYGAYPQIVATGGDAARLFEGDELVEHLVPDLTLMGIQAACERALADDAHDPDGDA